MMAISGKIGVKNYFSLFLRVKIIEKFYVFLPNFLKRNVTQKISVFLVCFTIVWLYDLICVWNAKKAAVNLGF